MTILNDYEENFKWMFNHPAKNQDNNHMSMRTLPPSSFPKDAAESFNHQC